MRVLAPLLRVPSWTHAVWIAGLATTMSCAPVLAQNAVMDAYAAFTTANDAGDTEGANQAYARIETECAAVGYTDLNLCLGAGGQAAEAPTPAADPTPEEVAARMLGELAAPLADYDNALALAAGGGDVDQAHALADRAAAEVSRICAGYGKASVEDCLGHPLGAFPLTPDEQFAAAITGPLQEYQNAVDTATNGGDYAQAAAAANDAAALVVATCTHFGRAAEPVNCLGFNLPPLPAPPDAAMASTETVDQVQQTEGQMDTVQQDLDARFADEVAVPVKDYDSAVEYLSSGGDYDQALAFARDAAQRVADICVKYGRAPEPVNCLGYTLEAFPPRPAPTLPEATATPEVGVPAPDAGTASETTASPEGGAAGPDAGATTPDAETPAPEGGAPTEPAGPAGLTQEQVDQYAAEIEGAYYDYVAAIETANTGDYAGGRVAADAALAEMTTACSALGFAVADCIEGGVPEFPAAPAADAGTATPEGGAPAPEPETTTPATPPTNADGGAPAPEPETTTPAEGGIPSADAATTTPTNADAGATPDAGATTPDAGAPAPEGGAPVEPAALTQEQIDAFVARIQAAYGAYSAAIETANTGDYAGGRVAADAALVEMTKACSALGFAVVDCIEGGVPEFPAAPAADAGTATPEGAPAPEPETTTPATPPTNADGGAPAPETEATTPAEGSVPSADAATTTPATTPTNADAGTTAPATTSPEGGAPAAGIGATTPDAGMPAPEGGAPAEPAALTQEQIDAFVARIQAAYGAYSAAIETANGGDYAGGRAAADAALAEMTTACSALGFAVADCIEGGVPEFPAAPAADAATATPVASPTNADGGAPAPRPETTAPTTPPTNADAGSSTPATTPTNADAGATPEAGATPDAGSPAPEGGAPATATTNADATPPTPTNADAGTTTPATTSPEGGAPAAGIGATTPDAGMPAPKGGAPAEPAALTQEQIDAFVLRIQTAYGAYSAAIETANGGDYAGGRVAADAALAEMTTACSALGFAVVDCIEGGVPEFPAAPAADTGTATPEGGAPAPEPETTTPATPPTNADAGSLTLDAATTTPATTPTNTDGGATPDASATAPDAGTPAPEGGAPTPAKTPAEGSVPPADAATTTPATTPINADAGTTAPATTPDNVDAGTTPPDLAKPAAPDAPNMAVPAEIVSKVDYYNALARDPNLAVGNAKEIVELSCKNFARMPDLDTCLSTYGLVLEPDNTTFDPELDARRRDAATDIYQTLTENYEAYRTGRLSQAEWDDFNQQFRAFCQRLAYEPNICESDLARLARERGAGPVATTTPAAPAASDPFADADESGVNKDILAAADEKALRTMLSDAVVRYQNAEASLGSAAPELKAWAGSIKAICRQLGFDDPQACLMAQGHVLKPNPLPGTPGGVELAEAEHLRQQLATAIQRTLVALRQGDNATANSFDPEIRTLCGKLGFGLVSCGVVGRIVHYNVNIAAQVDPDFNAAEARSDITRSCSFYGFGPLDECLAHLGLALADPAPTAPPAASLPKAIYVAGLDQIQDVIAAYDALVSKNRQAAAGAIPSSELDKAFADFTKICTEKLGISDISTCARDITRRQTLDREGKTDAANHAAGLLLPVIDRYNGLIENILVNGESPAARDALPGVVRELADICEADGLGVIEQCLLALGWANLRQLPPETGAQTTAGGAQGDSLQRLRQALANLEAAALLPRGDDNMIAATAATNTIVELCRELGHTADHAYVGNSDVDACLVATISTPRSAAAVAALRWPVEQGLRVLAERYRQGVALRSKDGVAGQDLIDSVAGLPETYCAALGYASLDACFSALGIEPLPALTGVDMVGQLKQAATDFAEANNALVDLMKAGRQVDEDRDSQTRLAAAITEISAICNIIADSEVIIADSPMSALDDCLKEQGLPPLPPFWKETIPGLSPDVLADLTMMVNDYNAYAQSTAPFDRDGAAKAIAAYCAAKGLGELRHCLDAAGLLLADQSVTTTTKEQLPDGTTPTNAAPLLDSAKGDTGGLGNPATPPAGPTTPGATGGGPGVPAVGTQTPAKGGTATTASTTTTTTTTTVTTLTTLAVPKTDAEAQGNLPKNVLPATLEPGKTLDPTTVRFTPPPGPPAFGGGGQGTSFGSGGGSGSSGGGFGNGGAGGATGTGAAITFTATIAPNGGFMFQFGANVVISNPEQERNRVFNPQTDDIAYEGLSGGRVRETITRDDGKQVITIRDPDGGIDKRQVVLPNGQWFMLAAGASGTGTAPGGTWRDPGDDLPPLRLTIPARDYVLDADQADEGDLAFFLVQPPVERVQRIYTIDEVKHSARLRDSVRRLEIGGLTFDSGKSTVGPDQIRSLGKLAQAMIDLLERDPAETFLIEGHTDAVGDPYSNLALSDDRANEVARVLTVFFGVPAENLATQGYGESFLKVRTEAAERLNRRVTVRRITPLITVAGRG